MTQTQTPRKRDLETVGRLIRTIHRGHGIMAYAPFTYMMMLEVIDEEFETFRWEPKAFYKELSKTFAKEHYEDMRWAK